MILSLDDPRWEGLEGGYKVPYNPVPTLRDLENGENIDGSWVELWEELHHQGDLGTASYAAVSYLTQIQKWRRSFDWNFYSLVSVIEIERKRKTNPPLSGWLEKPYQDAWVSITELALEELRKTDEELTLEAALGAVAIGRGLRKHGAIIVMSSRSEIEEFLDEQFRWNATYR